MYISLYRKYRPQKFSDMVGQTAAVSLLLESLREHRLGHAYLFSGPRGCGKTSAARLVAKSLICTEHDGTFEPCGHCANCVSIAQSDNLDVIEIDGASNRGINEIRDLKSHVNLKPLSSDYKIYIIDEVHMLTEAAFNALLKTLEEPPRNVIFLLATTEPHKVPVTIRSRCQHIPFHRIALKDMLERLSYVCDKEKIVYDHESLWEIARQADGALRDALSLTEQAISLGQGELTSECIENLTGGSSRTSLEKWVSHISSEPEKCATELSEMLAGGMSPERFCESLFTVFRDMWMYSLWNESITESLEISDKGLIFLKEETPNWTTDKLSMICELLNMLMPRTRQGIRSDVFSGILLIKLFAIYNNKPIGTMLDRTPNTASLDTVATLEKNNNVSTKQQPVVSQQKNTVSQNVASEYKASNEVKRTETKPVKKQMATPGLSTILDSMGIKNDIDKTAIDLSGVNIDYRNIVEALDSRKILIGSALLYASVLLEDEKLVIKVDDNPIARKTLSLPINKKILLRALKKVFPYKINEENISNENSTNMVSNETSVHEIFPVIKTEKKSNKQSKIDKTISKKTKFPETSTPGTYSPKMMMELMMAEVLYEHDHYEQSETEDGSTE